MPSRSARRLRRCNGGSLAIAGKYTDALAVTGALGQVDGVELTILLCLSSRDSGGRWVLEESPDAAGDVALDAASDLSVGLALGASLGAVDTGRFVVGSAGERDDVEGTVELAIAIAIEAMAILALAGRHRDGCDAAEASERGLVATAAWM